MAPPTVTTPPPPPTATWRGDLFDTAGTDPRDSAYFNRVMRGGTLCLWGETQARAFGGSPRAWTLQLALPMVTLLVVSIVGGVLIGVLSAPTGTTGGMVAAIVATALIILGATAWMIWLTASQRYKLRQKYGIQGSAWDDCNAWSWWGACAAAQEARTVDSLEVGKRSVQEGTSVQLNSFQ